MKVTERSLVIGLDPGTQTGWAVCTMQDYIIASGVESFAEVADRGYGAIFAAFRRFLGGLRVAQGVFAAIAYELPIAWGGAITTRITYGMAAHIQERCAVWRCRPLPVNIMTLKKFATGSGKADKGSMIRAASVVLGKQLPQAEIATSRVYSLSEHEADAIHVARWGAAHLLQGGNAGGES